MGGNSLVVHDIQKLLSVVYPEYNWEPWRFQKMSVLSVKPFMEMVSKKLKIKSLNDWYKVNKEQIKGFEGGESILKANKDSLYKILSTVYPEHTWLPWKFDQSKTYWSDSSNWKQVLEFIGQELNIKEMNDWSQIKTEVNSINK